MVFAHTGPFNILTGYPELIRMLIFTRSRFPMDLDGGKTGKLVLFGSLRTNAIRLVDIDLAPLGCP